MRAPSQASVDACMPEVNTISRSRWSAGDSAMSTETRRAVATALAARDERIADLAARVAEYKQANDELDRENDELRATIRALTGGE